MEDDLQFFQMEDYIQFFQMEDNLNKILCNQKQLKVKTMGVAPLRVT